MFDFAPEVSLNLGCFRVKILAREWSSVFGAGDREERDRRLSVLRLKGRATG
jgi:hypothetical protein